MEVCACVCVCVCVCVRARARVCVCVCGVYMHTHLFDKMKCEKIKDVEIVVSGVVPWQQLT